MRNYCERNFVRGVLECVWFSGGSPEYEEDRFSLGEYHFVWCDWYISQENLYWHQTKYCLEHKPSIKTPVRNISYTTQDETKFIDVFYIRSKKEICYRIPSILLKEAYVIHFLAELIIRVRYDEPWFN